MGCLSFVVISLSLTGHDDVSSHAISAARQGAVFLVGTCAPILVNWLLWPFVARHELRSALSSMLFYMSVVYRSKHPRQRTKYQQLHLTVHANTSSFFFFIDVNAKYVHFQEDHEPEAEDVAKSELLEGRLREGFVRLRQLLVGYSLSHQGLYTFTNALGPDSSRNPLTPSIRPSSILGVD